MNTPWGRAQMVKHIAPGIVQVSTASHGGIQLSTERQGEVDKRFPTFIPHAGGRWYEEDQDIAIVILTFPGIFDDIALRGAIRTVNHAVKLERTYHPERKPSDGWSAVQVWLNNTHEGMRLQHHVADWERRHADDWERRGMCSEGNSHRDRVQWRVDFTRIGDGKQIVVPFRRYPDKRIYSAKELQTEAETALATSTA